MVVAALVSGQWVLMAVDCSVVLTARRSDQPK